MLSKLLHNPSPNPPIAWRIIHRGSRKVFVKSTSKVYKKITKSENEAWYLFSFQTHKANHKPLKSSTVFCYPWKNLLILYAIVVSCFDLFLVWEHYLIASFITFIIIFHDTVLQAWGFTPAPIHQTSPFPLPMSCPHFSIIGKSLSTSITFRYLNASWHDNYRKKYLVF